MANATKTEKLVNALKKGAKLSVKQAMSRFGFETDSAVRGVVSKLRSSGVKIRTTSVNGTNRYSI